VAGRVWQLGQLSRWLEAEGLAPGQLTSDLEEWISGGLVANRMVNRVLRPSAVDRENPAFAGFSVRRV
jgi:hypothetical protein